MEPQTISINQVVDRCRRHPMLSGIPLETIVDYVIDFIGIVGFPEIYDEKFAIVEINNYRGVLPCDFIEMIQVRTTEKHPTCYRYATDTFHNSDVKGFKSLNLTYKIQGNVIFTSNKDGNIEIAYKSIAVDDNGFPLIPDNVKFIRALENFIKLQHFTILFDMGKLHPQILNNTQQEYDWSVGQCTSEFKMMTLDKAESVFNNFSQIIINTKDHLTGYSNIGIKKEYKTH